MVATVKKKLKELQKAWRSFNQIFLNNNKKVWKQNLFKNQQQFCTLRQLSLNGCFLNCKIKAPQSSSSKHFADVTEILPAESFVSDSLNEHVFFFFWQTVNVIWDEHNKLFGLWSRVATICRCKLLWPLKQRQR